MNNKQYTLYATPFSPLKEPGLPLWGKRSRLSRKGREGGKRPPPPFHHRVLLLYLPNSLVVIVPSPSLSKREKASLNSAIYKEKERE